MNRMETNINYWMKKWNTPTLSEAVEECARSSHMSPHSDTWASFMQYIDYLHRKHTNTK